MKDRPVTVPDMPARLAGREAAEEGGLIQGICDGS